MSLIEVAVLVGSVLLGVSALILAGAYAKAIVLRAQGRHCMECALADATAMEAEQRFDAGLWPFDDDDDEPGSNGATVH